QGHSLRDVAPFGTGYPRPPPHLAVPVELCRRNCADRIRATIPPLDPGDRGPFPRGFGLAVDSAGTGNDFEKGSEGKPGFSVHRILACRSCYSPAYCQSVGSTICSFPVCIACPHDYRIRRQVNSSPSIVIIVEYL